MSQYQVLAKEHQDHHLEFERGSMSRDTRGSKRAKPKKESSKRKRKSKKERRTEEGYGGVRVDEVPVGVSERVHLV